MSEDRSGRPDDVALVRSVAGGSYDALADLYDRHGAAIFAVASRLTSDRGIAEEVVQDTFLALWDRATSFDPATGSLSAWLHTIARNRTVDRLRAAGRRPTLVAPPGQDDDGSDTGGLDRIALAGVVIGGAEAPMGPEAAAVSSETRSLIEASLAGMADEERTVIVLAYRDGAVAIGDRRPSRLAAGDGQDPDATGAAPPARHIGNALGHGRARIGADRGAGRARDGGTCPPGWIGRGWITRRFERHWSWRRSSRAGSTG